MLRVQGLMMAENKGVTRLPCFIWPGAKGKAAIAF